MAANADNSTVGIRFASPQQFTTGPGAWYVVAADFNRDGRPDLAVANAGSMGPDGVSLLINTTPKGSDQVTFKQCTSLNLAGASQQALAAVDLTGDGKLDLVVGNFFTTGNFPTSAGVAAAGPGIQVFANQTPPGADCPTFAPPIDITAGTGPEVLAVGDFNGDGLPDLVFTDYGIPGLPQTQDVSVVMNRGVHNGQLEFSPRFSYAVGSQPLGVSVADVNGDGRPDLVVGNNFSYNVSVLVNETPKGADQPTFSVPVNFPAGSAPIGPETLATGDLNGDGRPDIVTPNVLSSHGVSVLMNTTAPHAATPSFAATTDLDAGLGPQQIAIADFGGDGKPDIAVALQGTVAAGNQAVVGPGGVSPLNPLNPLSNPLGQIINGVSSGVQVFDNLTPTGASQPALAAPAFFAAGNGSDSLTVADFNGDGKPDLAVANNLTAGAAGVSVLLNDTPLASQQRSRSAGQFTTVGRGTFGLPNTGSASGDRVVVLALLLPGLALLYIAAGRRQRIARVNQIGRR